MIGEERENLMRLENNPVKQYEWGSTNKNCQVARLSKRSNCKNYAEMWMGVHYRGQSQVKQMPRIEAKKQPLEFMKLSEYFSKNNLQPIQFLYKVLSIQKCLSIQVHPNKKQAVQLHQKWPDVYADPNDKPEMFYTLSEFECFFGYINQQEFERIKASQPFKSYFQQYKPTNPRQMITAILKLSEEAQHLLYKECLTHLKQIHPQRYNESNKTAKIWKIFSDFPGDIGIAVSFFLEYKIIPAGTCYQIECNTPHAYIYGQCLEIMKNSDNVCRLGLTPKYKDMNVIEKVLGNNFDEIKPVGSHKTKTEGFMQYLYHSKGLYFLIIQAERGQKSASLLIQPRKQFKICLIIEGEFQISDEWHISSQQLQNDNICKEGNVILLKPAIKYQFKNRLNQEGLVCIGWSEF